VSEFDSITTPDEVFELAVKKTGLTDIDSDSWRPGLTLILDELNVSPAFTVYGRDKLISDSVNCLSRRLRINDYVKSFPEVLEKPIERPLFVLGMPRTGTTVISNLLDRDPARRSLLYWECMDPIPPATTETLRTDPRCLAMLEEQRAVVAALKEAKVAMPHWDDADNPIEDMFIHDQDFKGLVWDAYMPTSKYGDWLINEADMTSAYEYQKIYLQVLQSKAPGEWNLKMPSHAVHIDTLLKVFPDAQIVWTHRDPYKATGSLCNTWMLPKGMVLDPDRIDKHDMGRRAKEQMREHVGRPLRARDRIGDDRFFHMYYHRMMDDPMKVMQQIYEWAGDAFTLAVQAHMLAWLDDHPQDRFAPNTYNLHEYGLSVDELEPVFAEYLDAFDIAMESTR
jgi:hypothetical protein